MLQKGVTFIQKWTRNEEILSVCRRIRRANKSSKGLLDVFEKEDESICLIIKRNQDGRIQVVIR